MKRRFYTDVAVVENSSSFAIHLDGRPVKTPARASLEVPYRALADAIAAEWLAQGTDIIPSTMPFTGMSNAALDLIAPGPHAFCAPLIAYAQSDLLCYRAPDADLAKRQQVEWDPLLNWASERYGARLGVTTGIIHIAQPPAAIAALAAAVHNLDPYRLAAMSPLVTISGSLVIALAILENALGADQSWSAVTLDECWQEERWGADADAVATRALKLAEWASAIKFLSLLS